MRSLSISFEMRRNYDNWGHSTSNLTGWFSKLTGKCLQQSKKDGKLSIKIFKNDYNSRVK